MDDGRWLPAGVGIHSPREKLTRPAHDGRRMRVLTDDDVTGLLSLPALLDVVEDALRRQGEGAVERPPRPHFPVGTDRDGADPQGTGLVMPAYLHGADTYATKLASVHEGNPDQGLPTVHAQVVVSDARTGEPLALLDGRTVTNARTGCVGGLAARHLAAGDGPHTLGVLGGGAQARWQTRAIDAAVDLGPVRVYSPNSRASCAADLRERGVDATAVDSPRQAVDGADIVVTATTSRDPVFPGDALAPGTLVVAIGAYTAEMRELDAETFARADQVFADVPDEVRDIGDIAGNGVDPDRLIPFSDALSGATGREADDVVVVESVGSAVMDAAAAAHLLSRAESRGVGRNVPL